jgi:hypothetical protein
VAPMAPARIRPASILVLVTLDIGSRVAHASRTQRPSPSAEVAINFRMAFVWILTSAKLVLRVVCLANVRTNQVPIFAFAARDTSISAVLVWILTNARLVLPVVCLANARTSQVPIFASATRDISLSAVLVWISMNVILLNKILVGVLVPVLILLGPTRVLVEAVLSSAEVHAWISMSAIHQYRILVEPLELAPIHCDRILALATVDIRSLQVLVQISMSAPQEHHVGGMESARIRPVPILVLVTLGISSRVAHALRIQSPFPSVPVVIN